MIMTSTHEEEGQSSSGSEVRVKQTDGRTDTTESITFLANVVGNDMPSISSQQVFHGEIGGISNFCRKTGTTYRRFNVGILAYVFLTDSADIVIQSSTSRDEL